MKRIFLIVFVIFILGISWSSIGKQFEQGSDSSIIATIKNEFSSMVENEAFKDKLQALLNSFQALIGSIEDKFNMQETTPKQIDKPQLTAPADHIFSIHNIEIGDSKNDVIAMLGEPKRISYNEYETNWFTYHEDYQNFVNVMFNEMDKVVGLYTNQDLISSTKGIKLGSSKEVVLEQLGKPLTTLRKGLILYQLPMDADYNLFQIDDSFVTVFYDKHENNTVTAIQIIERGTEKKKKEIYTTATDQLKEGFEYQMFDLTNAARVNHSLRTLTWDDHVKNTARKHSLDMAENHYFNHTNLQGQSPFDRMEEDHLIFTLAGENLAHGQFSSIYAHEGLMNSLGHRENILKPEYKYLGVGVAFNAENQPYYTQNYYTK
ncbi:MULTISPECIES: CAP domain-containing protein [Bacillus]|uniref:CAP domain-containing protein n=1 Tax=Bacillus TaxID=1386 RepID=UPI0003013BF6|nr:MULTISPECIES: CAP domain-containing protein [Bacillus]